jgi:hypothetical protein
VVDVATFGTLDAGIHYFTTCLFTGANQGLRGRITNTGTGPLSLRVLNCQFNSSTGPGIELSGPFLAWCTNLAGTCVTGFTVAQGARVKVDSTSAITGSTQDILIDSTAVSLATMRAASPKLVSSTYFSIVHE